MPAIIVPAWAARPSLVAMPAATAVPFVPTTTAVVMFRRGGTCERNRQRRREDEPLRYDRLRLHWYYSRRYFLSYRKFYFPEIDRAGLNLKDVKISLIVKNIREQSDMRQIANRRRDSGIGVRSQKEAVEPSRVVSAARFATRSPKLRSWSTRATAPIDNASRAAPSPWGWSWRKTAYHPSGIEPRPLAQQIVGGSTPGKHSSLMIPNKL
jgi:hypothetical protein